MEQLTLGDTQEAVLLGAQGREDCTVDQRVELLDGDVEIDCQEEGAGAGGPAHDHGVKAVRCGPGDL